MLKAQMISLGYWLCSLQCLLAQVCWNKGLEPDILTEPDANTVISTNQSPEPYTLNRKVLVGPFCCLVHPRNKCHCWRSFTVVPYCIKIFDKVYIKCDWRFYTVSDMTLYRCVHVKMTVQYVEVKNMNVNVWTIVRILIMSVWMSIVLYNVTKGQRVFSRTRNP